jgi:hypothetical protein
MVISECVNVWELDDLIMMVVDGGFRSFYFPRRSIMNFNFLDKDDIKKE